MFHLSVVLEEETSLVMALIEAGHTRVIADARQRARNQNAVVISQNRSDSGTVPFEKRRIHPNLHLVSHSAEILTCLVLVGLGSS